MDDLIEVIVKGVAPDMGSGQYKVVLQDKETGRILLIWVGHFEGNAIALGLEESWTPRPMTHDLMGSIINSLNTHVDRVVITDLKQNTFYAVIYLVNGGKEVPVDSRPSDAIALAVRQKSAIYISKKLSDKMIDEVDELFSRLQPPETIH